MFGPAIMGIIGLHHYLMVPNSQKFYQWTLKVHINLYTIVALACTVLTKTLKSLVLRLTLNDPYVWREDK